MIASSAAAGVPALKILFPIHGLGTGVGSEDYMVDVARRLADRGHQITFVIPRGGRAPAGIAAEVIVRPAPSAPRALLWRVSYLLAIPQEILTAAALRGLDRFDAVVTGVLPSLCGIALRTPRLPRCYLTLSPLAKIELLSYGESTVNLRIAARLYHELQKWAWRRSDVVVSFVEGLTTLRSNYLGAAPRAVVESCPGVDFGRFHPGDRDPARLADFGIPPDAPIVVSFCRLIRSKDIAFLIRAFARPEIPTDAHLLVLGRGPEHDALQRLSTDLGIAPRVHFAGFREDVETYLRLGHVYAFPSRLESFGLTLAQALATGLPSIARRTRVPDVLTVSESVITDGENGYLVDTEAEMASAIARILADPQLLTAMAARAAERARAMFDWDRHVDGIEAALLRLVERGRRPPTG